MRDLFIFAIAFAATLAAVRHPYIGVLAWHWVSLMNPHRLAWGWLYSFQIAQMVAIGTFAGLLFSKDRKHLPIAPLTVVLALFVAWMLVTSLFALYPDKIGDQFAKVMKIQLMVFVTLALIHSRQQIVALMAVTAASLAFFGIKGGVFTILTAGAYRVWGPPGSFIADNNHFALAMVMTVPLLFFLYQESSRRWLRWGLLAAMVLSVLAALGTHSRGGLIAAAGMALLLWWRSGRRLALLPVLIVAAATTLAFMPDQWWERMDSIRDYREDESAMGRFNAWSMAWNLAADRFFGGGFWVFEQELFDRYSMNPEDGVRAAHSIYFQALGEHGFVGLALFCLVWFVAWRDAGWLIRHAATDPATAWTARMGAMIQVSLVGYLVGGAFLSLAYFDLPYLLAVMALAARRWVREQRNQPAPGAVGAAAGRVAAAARSP
jgi:putative inorganic carbon (HCO3(-)) transporter